ncbi:MAG: DinB family protein [Roseococcus sp.]|nr:DinB family protein [Roseococcus sp.]
MITPAWCRAMAAYNSEMNRRLYASAATLEEAARRLDLGAFFASLHGTLCHILWADRVWMHRLAGWERPPGRIPDSPRMIEEWEALCAARAADDARIEAWAEALAPADLAGDLTWFSGAARRAMTKPRWLCVAHMFNHQTHHRGQAHALLTRLGARPGDTDLPWVIPDRPW